MGYLVAIIGFILGFLGGQSLLLRMLKDYSNKEILENPSLRWKFGTLNWILAFVGGYAALGIYNYFFL